MNPNDVIFCGDHCLQCCPYLMVYVHPFYRHTAWCNHVLRNLIYYDGGYIAECKNVDPDKHLSKVVELGYKGNNVYRDSSQNDKD